MSALFALAFVVVMCGLGIYVMEKDSGNYWEYEGAWDFYRMPLEEPYELVMIDTMDSASINKWKEGSTIVGDIVEYEKRGALIAGHCQHTSYSFYTKDKPWFVFDCATGQVDTYASKEAFEDACTQKGFSLPLDMKSIRENWNAYWGNPNRRRK